MSVFKARVLSGLVLSLFLTAGSGRAAIDYVGLGPQLNLVVAEDIGAGVGGGFHFLFGFNLGNAGAVQVYPNIQMWYGHEEEDVTPNIEVDRHAFEISFNADARYYFPVPLSLVLAPYAGFGFAPIIAIEECDPEYSPWRDDTDVGGAFNFFAGIDFPIMGDHKAFGEFRGKAGESYELMKFVGGFTFTLH